MQVVYVGPHLEGVDIAATGQTAYPGTPIEVSDDIHVTWVDAEGNEQSVTLGQSLCQQVSNWQEYKPAAAVAAPAPVAQPAPIAEPADKEGDA